jgi:hypothetical protein
MRAQAAGLAEHRPRRSRHFAPARVSPRGEFTAALATAALLAQLLLAPVTLVVVGVADVVSRVSRWRPHWLAGPAAVGLAWVLAVGPAQAVAGFVAGPRRLAGYLSALPGGTARLAHLQAAFAGAAHLLPRQLPLALVAGPAQAGVIAWFRSRRAAGPEQWRPGLVAAVRRRIVAGSLSAGHTVTADGCAMGIETGTGRRAGLSWAEAERGVLASGADPGALLEVCLPVAGAALRRRKAVLVADLSGHGVAAAVTERARNVGVTVRELGVTAPGPAGLDGLTAAAGLAIRRRQAAVLPPDGRAVSGLAAVLAGLADAGLRGDALAWIHGFGPADAGPIGQIITLGSATGCGVLLSTTSPAAAAGVAAAAEVIVAAGPASRDLALQLAGQLPGADRKEAAADALARQPAGTFALLTRGRAQPLAMGCAAVPARPAAGP